MPRKRHNHVAIAADLHQVDMLSSQYGAWSEVVRSIHALLGWRCLVPAPLGNPNAGSR